MPASDEPKPAAVSTLSIGVGGMVGGGFFAVTGLAGQITNCAVPIAFLVAVLVAMLTGYFCSKLTLRFPGSIPRPA